MTDSQWTVRENTNRNRFEILDEDFVAGKTLYVDSDGKRIFFHTEVDEDYAGMGLGSQLVREALTQTRAANLRVVPMCPYVAAYLKRHDDFDDIVAPVTPTEVSVVQDFIRSSQAI